MDDINLNEIANESPKEISSNVENLELSSDGNFTLPLRRGGFEDENDFIKYIKNIERLIRTSTEYKEWVKYITDVLGYTSCALTDEKSTEVSIQIHHHPFNLFTIVKIVLLSYINKEKEFCTFDISQDVIDLHFQNRVGYIPLVTTLHEKYHSGFLSIPIDFVHGDFKYILNNYKIDEEDMNVIGTLMTVHSDQLREQWSKNNYPGVVNG